jgi:hypothetical protein
VYYSGLPGSPLVFKFFKIHVEMETISPLSPNVTEIKRYTRRFNKIKIAGKLVLYFGYNIYETGKQHPIAAHNLHVYLCNSFN